MTRPAPSRRSQRGQSTLDYMLGCAALAFALFVPLRDGASPDEPRTAVEIVLSSFRQAYERISYSISLPA
jgi:hypothetical protein